MRNVKYASDETVVKKAVQVLMKELGPVDAMRFVNMSRKKRMESVKRHREWQKRLSKSKFFDDVFRK